MHKLHEYTQTNKQTDTIIQYNSYTITIIIIVVVVVVVVEQIESLCVIKRIIVHFFLFLFLYCHCCYWGKNEKFEYVAFKKIFHAEYIDHS